MYLGCGPLDATNVLKHLIDQPENRILQLTNQKCFKVFIAPSRLQP